MKSQLLSLSWLIALSLLAGVAGQTSLKLGITLSNGGDDVSGPLSLIGLILRSPLIWLGLFLYALSALAWIALLTKVDLSLAYPFVALNFLLVAFSSRLLLSETITTLRWMGIFVICIGVLLIALSSYSSAPAAE